MSRLASQKNSRQPSVQCRSLAQINMLGNQKDALQGCNKLVAFRSNRLCWYRSERAIKNSKISGVTQLSPVSTQSAWERKALDFEPSENRNLTCTGLHAPSSLFLTKLLLPTHKLVGCFLNVKVSEQFFETLPI